MFGHPRFRKFNFKNSLLDGKYTQFWNTKTVKVNGMYEAGLEKGTWEFFDSLGVKIKEEIYVNGELTKTKEFLSDGDIFQVAQIPDSNLYAYKLDVRVYSQSTSVV